MERGKGDIRDDLFFHLLYSFPLWVWELYWLEKDPNRIVTYCQKDVTTVAQIFLKMNGEPLIREENIEIKS